LKDFLQDLSFFIPLALNPWYDPMVGSSSVSCSSPSALFLASFLVIASFALYLLSLPNRSVTSVLISRLRTPLSLSSRSREPPPSLFFFCLHDSLLAPLFRHHLFFFALFFSLSAYLWEGSSLSDKKLSLGQRCG